MITANGVSSDTELIITFYGDDFTGSTDAMESLTANGIRTILFLEPPEPDDFTEELKGVEAIGVAGTSRGMTPTEMDEALPLVFEKLQQFDSELFHYKVCSTFDSSPKLGSIGHAIDIGADIFDSLTVPLVVAAPDLQPRGRYVAFGNLFATVDNVTYRLDRHPTMKDHPVTPMSEADIRRHLSKQTTKDIGLVDLLELEGVTEHDAWTAFASKRADNSIVLFDTVTDTHQSSVGEMIWKHCTEQSDTVFAAGSSGLEYALADHLQTTGAITGSPSLEPLDRHVPTVVISGSVSPVTSAQIDWGLEREFDGYCLNSARLIDPAVAIEAKRNAIQAALNSIDAGQSVMLYTARGPEDDTVDETKERASDLGLDSTTIGRRLGQRQGEILREILDRRDIDRVCVAGGDTSGHVAPALDIYALEMLVPLAPGSPLCRAYSGDERFDGLEIALKGGQVGQPDFFGLVQDGGKSELDSEE